MRTIFVGALAVVAVLWALMTVPRADAQVDGSGAIVAGGVSQQVFPARQGRIYLYCQNVVGALETLFVNAPTTAAVGPSYELPAGAALVFDGGFVPQGAVHVMAGTAGHRFVCKQG